MQTQIKLNSKLNFDFKVKQDSAGTEYSGNIR